MFDVTALKRVILEVQRLIQKGSENRTKKQEKISDKQG